MDDAKFELNLLRKQHQEAIKKCEFVKAKALNKQIINLNEQLKMSNSDKKRLDNHMEYTRVKDCIRSRSAEEFSKAYQRIYIVRSDFQHRLSDLLTSQSEQLTGLATSYAKALEICTLRTVVESDNMTKEAQVKAKYGDYDLAQTLFEIANSTRELTTAQRQEEVHAMYERMQEQLKKKHTEELKLNMQKRHQSFVEVKQEYDRAVDQMRKTLTAAAIKLQVQQNLEEEEKLFEDLVITGDDHADIPISPLSPRSPMSKESSLQSNALSPTRFRKSPAQSPRGTPKSRANQMSPKYH